MSKKLGFIVTQLVIGLCMVAISFMIQDESLKAVSGLLIGIGSGLIGMNVASLITRHYENRNPEFRKKNEIEELDERNIAIRARAKAKSGDIIQWFIIGIAYMTILIEAQLWVTLVVVAVYVFYFVLQFYYMNKFQKEM